MFWMRSACADIEDRLGAMMNIRRAPRISASVAAVQWLLSYRVIIISSKIYEKRRKQ